MVTRDTLKCPYMTGVPSSQVLLYILYWFAQSRSQLHVCTRHINITCTYYKFILFIILPYKYYMYIVHIKNLFYFIILPYRYYMYIVHITNLFYFIILPYKYYMYIVHITNLFYFIILHVCTRTCMCTCMCTCMRQLGPRLEAVLCLVKQPPTVCHMPLLKK